jgi:hypothetical protein
MATLRLGRYEVKEFELPRLCARCGQEAVVAPEKRFSWHPPWCVAFILLGCIGLAIYMILAIVLTKRMTVPLPLCERHRNYWQNRQIVIFGGLLAVVLLSVLGFFVAAMFDTGFLDDDSLLVAVLVAVGLFLAWLLTAAIMGSSGMRAKEISDLSITLVGLSEDFVSEVRQDRRGRDDEDQDDKDEDRVRRKRQRDEDDRPRDQRRPAKEEDDGGYYDPKAERRGDREDKEDDDR